MIWMFGFTFLATILGIVFGSFISLVSKKLPRKLLVFLQNFSLGSLLALIFIELFNESVENISDYWGNNVYGALTSLSIILFVGILFFALHELLHLLTHHHDHDHDDDEECHDHAHSTEIFKGKSLIAESFIFLGAISIHNIPEGFALGSTFINSKSIPFDGIIISIVLFIHNLLIGFIMCNSFINANKSKKFSFFITLISAIPAFVFAVISYFIGSINISSLFTGIIFAISTGSLIYVLFIELLPQTFKEFKSKYTFVYILLGIVLCGLLIFLGE